MTNQIKHRGIVEKIDGSHIQVRIVQTSACSSCSIKSHCNASESKDKIIDVYNINESNYYVGQEVNLIGTTSMGMHAVMIAFCIPFIVMILSLFIAMYITHDELKSALVALLSLIPIYVVIYLFRNKMIKKFSFSLEFINN